jgi:hypothetical protein
MVPNSFAGKCTNRSICQRLAENSRRACSAIAAMRVGSGKR